jgi:hypothetical protein
MCRLLRPILGVSLIVCGCARDESVDVIEQAGNASPLRIALTHTDGQASGFDVSGLSAEQQATVEAMDGAARADLLSVRVDGAGDDAPAVGGDVSWAGGGFHFAPRYPLREGVSYRVAFLASRLSQEASPTDDVIARFEVSRPAGDPTVVAHIYPSADHLPENQLKFYLHFSAPMSRGEAYRRVHLLDAAGKEVEAPFLELGEELWDPDMRRFTLFCDPGRVKRGLKPREELGPVLEEGKSYALLVDGEWTDANGQPLAAEARKSFDALPPDDAPVDTTTWKIEPPAAGTRDPVIVRFAEPLDHALVGRMLSIADSAGQTVAGSIEVDERETRWRFSPEEPWRAGDYQLVADTRLEDLAGNSIGRAFDVDVFGPVQTSIKTETVALPFTVVAATK